MIQATMPKKMQLPKTDFTFLSPSIVKEGLVLKQSIASNTLLV
jgi:hypothetical protein